MSWDLIGDCDEARVLTENQACYRARTIQYSLDRVDRGRGHMRCVHGDLALFQGPYPHSGRTCHEAIGIVVPEMQGHVDNRGTSPPYTRLFCEESRPPKGRRSTGERIQRGFSDVVWWYLELEFAIKLWGAHVCLNISLSCSLVAFYLRCRTP